MWNFYYRFEKERQLDRWEAEPPEKDGSITVSCSVESEKDTEKKRNNTAPACLTKQRELCIYMQV